MQQSDFEVFDANEIDALGKLGAGSEPQLEKRITALELQKEHLLEQVQRVEKKKSLLDGMISRLENVRKVSREVAAHTKTQKALKALQTETGNLIHEVIEERFFIKICIETMLFLRFSLNFKFEITR